MNIEHIHLSSQSKDKLVRLKRLTGIKNWNVLCRWAFCVSIADPTPIKNTDVSSDAAIEMTWKVFGGNYSEIYFALLKERCKKDCIDINQDNLIHQLKLHLIRGINSLTSLKLTSINDLLSLSNH